ncbi:hypothetical protein [Mycobacteroides abscessus]|uniref:hypothetical protein n=1 Tax=Mycobacteroides abscessus TaxID=36809 RepID=UPI000C259532|nr:hypothetical protein [Mycobacteroides abscessus]
MVEVWPPYPPELYSWQREGKIQLFHRTSAVNAKNIAANGEWQSKEHTQVVYFSNRRTGQAEGYGPVVVSVIVPKEIAQLDDEFPDGEEHYTIKISDLRNYPVQIDRAP